MKPQARRDGARAAGPHRADPRVSEVRPRVSGIVVNRMFHQGSEVKVGDPLYQIDPRPFEVEVQSTEAASGARQGRARTGLVAGPPHRHPDQPACGAGSRERKGDRDAEGSRGRRAGPRGRCCARKAQPGLRHSSARRSTAPSVPRWSLKARSSCRTSAASLATIQHYGRLTRLLEMVEAGHPVPDAAGLAGAQKAIDFAASATADDLARWCCSRGAPSSANWIAPAEGVELDDKRAFTRALLRSGANITEINTVRKHLSRIKGGAAGGAGAAGQGGQTALHLRRAPGDDLGGDRLRPDRARPDHARRGARRARPLPDRPAALHRGAAARPAQ